MQCKCGGPTIDRVQVINKISIDYKHCPACKRNDVSELNKIKLKDAENEKR